MIDIWIHCPIHTYQTCATALLSVIQPQNIILALAEVNLFPY